jgi:hypothetical protein
MGATKVSTICQQCATEFLAEKRDLKRGRGKFCSLKCFYDSIRDIKKVSHDANVTCSTCGTDFYKRPSELKGSKSGLYFCTRACKDKAQKIGGIEAIQPDHYGTASGIHTYRDILKTCDSPECERCGYDEHIEILQVHHRDRNRMNNKESNLEILCPNCHHWEHFSKKDGMYGRKGK